MKKEKKEKDNTNLKRVIVKKNAYGTIGIVVILLAIALVFIIQKGPKKTISNFIDGMNKQNSSKIIESLDFVGMKAWGYYFDEENFSEKDYEKFLENYEEILNNIDKEDLKESKEYLKEVIEESFKNNNDKYKSYKIKIEKFENTKELGKDLYAIDTKISIKAEQKDKDEIDETEVLTFIVYKDKVIYAGGIGF